MPNLTKLLEAPAGAMPHRKLNAPEGLKQPFKKIKIWENMVRDTFLWLKVGELHMLFCHMLSNYCMSPKQYP